MTTRLITEDMMKVADTIIPIQNILLNVTLENIEKSIEELLEQKMSQTRTGLVYICTDFMHILAIRHYKSHIYAQFLCNVSQKIPGLFSLVLAQLIQPAKDSHLKCIHLRILRELHQNNIVSLDDIITAIVNFPQTESNQYMLFFLFFGKEIERTNHPVFTALAENCSKLQNLGPTYQRIQSFDLVDILQRPVESDFKWEKIEDYCLYGCQKGTAFYYVKQNIRRLIDSISPADLDKLFDPSTFDMQLFGSSKCTLTQYAAFNGAFESLRALMSKKSKFRNPDSDGHFIQPYAVASGQLKIVQQLQERMLDFTGLIGLCCQYRNNESFDFLLNLEKDEKSKKEQVNQGFLACAQSNNVSGLMKCLEKGANIRTKGPDGKTALHYACIQDSIFIVKILSMCEDVNINATDDAGCTPLHYAAQLGNVEIVDFLLKLPSISKNIKNIYGKTALESTQK